jgi:cytochrome b6-f complex iron-sulfur subunit
MSSDLRACAGRRRFLQVLARGGALAGAASLGIGCGGGLSGTYAGGNVKDLPVGTLTALSGEPLAVGRDAQGVYAMSLICTHAGCDMASPGSVSSEVVCPCHGSRFDANGNVLQGPAQTALEHFEVTIDTAGAISIDADVPVDAGARAAVTSG